MPRHDEDPGGRPAIDYTALPCARKAPNLAVFY